MEEILLNYLREEILNNQTTSKLSAEDDLLGSGLLDSMSLMRMIAFIEKKFESKIPPQDLVIENFETVRAIAAYLQTRVV